MMPYKCPICNGSGIVPGGFYLSTGNFTVSDRTTEPCRACNGTGVLWGPQTFKQEELDEDIYNG